VKLRKPWMIKLAAFLGVGVLRIWSRTLRCCTDSRGQTIEPWNPAVRERFIYALWHDSLFCIPRLRAYVNSVTVLISQSRDGELVALMGKRCGLQTVRGSSTRGGIEAGAKAIEAARRSHLLVIPDGPQGPRRKVKRGLICLASLTGRRIVPLGVGFDNAWHARSWDRFSIPKPWSKITVVAGPIITVPPGIRKADTEHYRKLLEDNMLTTSNAAQQWAEQRTPSAIARPQTCAQAA
jgi:lysophospholipid acyltransferase (LPLAT)-like uncharacterized protein